MITVYTISHHNPTVNNSRKNTTNNEYGSGTLHFFQKLQLSIRQKESTVCVPNYPQLINL